ncbi:MAG: transporter [Deltaproteobacteria bacterium]|nr:transporter [Deltaproteobacteria bacterium]
MRSRKALVTTAFVAALTASSVCHAQQDLGHKTLGTVGLDAGTQPQPGIYVSDRLMFYNANVLVGRTGQALPVGLDIDVVANGIGVLGVWKLPVLGASYGAAVAAPLTHVSAQTANPEASLDRFGLADAYLLPLQLGWHTPRLDVVASYALYAPTRNLAAGGVGGIGRSQWVQEPALGSTVFFDAARTWRLSALGSIDFYARKPGLDVTRGTSMQLQGGLGKTLARIVDVGVAGAALWQVSDDRGADLPPQLQGLRERAFSVGPELGLLIPQWRLKVLGRYEHDFGDRARPVGQIFLVGLSWAAWKPEATP